MTAPENIQIGRVREKDNLELLKGPDPKEYDVFQPSCACPEATSRCWDGVSDRASISPAASGKKSRWLERICGMHSFSFLTEPTAALDARS